MDKSEQIKDYIRCQLVEHPHDIVKVTADKFAVTRMTVHRHITSLINSGEVIKSGVTRDSSYYLSSDFNRKLEFAVTPELSEFSILNAYYDEFLSGFDKNIYDICYYGFTEIFNNSIDHARATKITVETKYVRNNLTMVISDNGIGVFENIKNYLKLLDIKESVLELSKGKLTTMPEHHSGEGIFFSSRVFDYFEIIANGIVYIRDNTAKDWGVKTLEQKSIKSEKGTKVVMIINKNSQTNLVDIFKNYQNEETLDFDSTEIIVELSKLGHDNLISRSQAKRILRGLDKFNKISLDFKNIRIVGQGFVDEIFRVYVKQRPNVFIDYLNANSDVEFMITRGLSSN